MLPLSSAAILEKNKISSTGSWLILLAIAVPGYPMPLRLVNNNEPIEWPASSNELYSPFPFLIDDVVEDGQGGLPTFSIRVSNVTRALIPYLEATNGLNGATVTLRIVHSGHLSITKAELEETVSVIGCGVDLQWVTIRCGAENPQRMRSPRGRYLKDHCRYGPKYVPGLGFVPGFKGPLCGYVGDETSCNRSFARCKELGNGSRFGGFPGIDGGMYVYGESDISPYSSLNYIYNGVTAKASGYSSADVTALAEYNRSNDNTRVFDVTPGVNEYILFASPTRLGLVTFRVNGFAGGFRPPEVVEVTNAQGYCEDYYVWRSTNLNLGPTTVTTAKA